MFSSISFSVFLRQQQKQQQQQHQQQWSSKASCESLQMIIRKDRPLAKDYLDGPASCKWSYRWTGLMQMIIWIDQPLANDHLDGPASYNDHLFGPASGLRELNVRQFYIFTKRTQNELCEAPHFCQPWLVLDAGRQAGRQGAGQAGPGLHFQLGGGLHSSQVSQHRPSLSPLLHWFSHQVNTSPPSFSPDLWTTIQLTFFNHHKVPNSWDGRINIWPWQVPQAPHHPTNPSKPCKYLFIAQILILTFKRHICNISNILDSSKIDNRPNIPHAQPT